MENTEVGRERDRIADMVSKHADTWKQEGRLYNEHDIKGLIKRIASSIRNGHDYI